MRRLKLRGILLLTKILIISEMHSKCSIDEKRRISISVIDSLLEDHKVINAMTDLLDISVEKAEKEKKLSAGITGKELEFCRDFINRWHETKEEQVLIPELHKSGYPMDRGPIWETIEDHRKGRSIIRRWVAIEKLTKEDKRLEHFIEYAGAYSLYLYEHIREEEQGLYHAAQLAIPEDRKEAMTTSSSALDKELAAKGGRERYQEIIAYLKKELP